MNSSVRRTIGIMAIPMIIFGLAEVVTGFNHNLFFGITTQTSNMSTLVGAMLGIFCLTAGFLYLTLKQRTIRLAITCLILDIIGRILMVTSGLFPLDSGKQEFSIIAGMIITAGFAMYLWLKQSVVYSQNS